MSLSHPSASDLIQAIQGFLTTTVAPQVDKHTAFHIKVACHMLAMLGRELDQQQAAESTVRQALIGMLQADQSAAKESLAALNELLCQQIRNGAINHNDPALLQALRDITTARLAIDNPSYSGLKASQRGGH